MRKILLFLFLLFLSIPFRAITQDTLTFMVNSYEDALATAERNGQSLLFYFHSSGCYDCPEVDSILQVDRLAGYLSLNFVNVKIDYDAPMGIRLSKQFRIGSLPSLVFLNDKQAQIFLLDEEFTTKTILDHARWTLNPTVRSQAYQEALRQKQKILNWEKVDSVFDFTVIDNRVFEKISAPTMYNQSLLHKTLNDGLAPEHAEAYLGTQEDWTTEKNTSFIMEFIRDTRSPEFDFLVKNKTLFTGRYGQARVDSLIEKLIHNRLYRLQPPPSYQEAQQLMGILSPMNTDVRTYEYLIELKLRTNKVIEYLHLERKYLQKFAPKDHERMIRLVNIYLNRIPEDYNVDYYLEIAKTANKLQPNNMHYLKTLTRVYIKKGDKCGALSAAVRAYMIALETGAVEEATELLQLIKSIDSMYRSL